MTTEAQRDLWLVEEELRRDRVNEAAHLLGELWEAVPARVGAERIDELRVATEELGKRGSTSPEVAEVFRRAARCCARNGHYRLARRMGIHELAVWRKRSDNESTLLVRTFTGYRTALDGLARIDRAVGRLHRVINCLDELLELQARHGFAVNADSAWTLRELGAVMLEAGRPDAAVRRYLSRADSFYVQLDESTAVIRQHATCLVLSALAHRALDRPTEADRCVNRALAVLLPTDPEAAAEVRVLTDESGTGDQLPVTTALPLVQFGLPAWPHRPF
ncbi:tetratricopeptide repeat protein [Actinosynnema sp. NPDC059797]